MEKFLALFLSAFSPMLTSAADIYASQQGVVYHFGFKIETITGIPEHQIEEYGCKYHLQRKYFDDFIVMSIDRDNILLEGEGRPGNGINFSYSRYDVRAKIVFQGNNVYYVNRQGVLRDGDKFYLIDKEKFESGLEFVSCQK